MRLGIVAMGRYKTAAPPPINIGLFAGGYSGGMLAVTDKYDFGTDVAVSGTNLVSASDAVGGTGNTVMAIFNGNGNTHKYVYATNVASATTLAGGPSGGAQSTGCGNETRGIFTRSLSPTITSKYVYADGSTAAGTVLPNAGYAAMAVGNSSFSIWAGGNDNLLASKYTYAGDTVAVAASLTVAHYDGACAGTPSVGLMFAGLYPGATFITNTSKYTYGTETVTAGTSVNIRRAGTGCGNSTRAIFGAGIAEHSSYTKLKTTQKYTYAGDTVAAATNLVTARYDLGSASSAPGGFS